MATSSSRQTQQAKASSTGTADGALLMHTITRGGYPDCELCGLPMVNESRYVGGRGYVTYWVCPTTGCGFSVQEVKR